MLRSASTTLYCGLGCVMVEVFGRGNIGFLLATMFFMVVEFGILLVRGYITPSKKDDITWYKAVVFWLRRAVLLALPLVGTGLDWAYYWAGDPETILGRGIHHYATKTICIGVLSYELREVIKEVARVWSDAPLIVGIIRAIDRIRIETLPMPAEEKKEAVKGRRYYDVQQRSPYGDILDPPEPDDEA